MAEDKEETPKEPTKAYRFKSDVGKHFVDGEPVEPGTVVQLNRRQSVQFKDKFVPEDGVGWGAGEPSGSSKGQSVTAEVLTGTVNDVRAEIEKIEDVDTLKKLRSEEKDGKQRQGVLNAIEARLEELAK
jgi:hypothetical protein